MDTVEILTNARALIEDPQHWTKGIEHRYAEVTYKETSKGLIFTRTHTVKKIVDQYCAMGAIAEAARPGLYASGANSSFTVPTTYDALMALQSAVGAYGVPGFNDNHHTTHAQVLEAFNRAIQAEKNKKIDALHASIRETEFRNVQPLPALKVIDAPSKKVHDQVLTNV